MQKPRNEDEGLVKAQFMDLNRQFFSKDRGPHTYLEFRLRGVLLASSNHASISAALDEGIKIGTLTAIGDFDIVESADNRELFAALDATVLFHHAAETLLRLTLALEQSQLCPWLEVARMKNRGSFPDACRRLGRRLQEPDTQDRLARIFYWRKDRHALLPGKNEEESAEVRAGVTALLAECISRLKTEAPLYNSAKHGLSAVQGHAAMSFAEDDDGIPLIKAEGPSLTYLEVPPGPKNRRRKWNQTTYWIEADRNLALTYLLIRQVENLWTVARHNYLGETFTGGLTPLPLTTLERALYGELPADGPAQIKVPSMSMTLLYDDGAPDKSGRL